MNSITLSSFRYSLQGMLFNLREKLTGYRKEKRIFKKLRGYELDLKNPQSYNEKIIWKKLFDRNPLLPIVADKYRVRKHLQDVLGEKEAEKILIPLLYVTDKPATIPFDNLPEEYIVKANHGSRMNIVVEKTNPADRKQIVAQCRKWLSEPYGLKMHEWAYQKIKRKIVIEKLLRDEHGKTPTEYNFSVIHGKCHLIQVICERFTDLKVGYYTPEWNHLNIKGKAKEADYIKRPEPLDAMIGLAELLGAPFDFIRVDLYLANGKVYFSELTNYPVSGKFVFTPMSYDFELGSKWKIVPQYWKPRRGFVGK